MAYSHAEYVGIYIFIYINHLHSHTLGTSVLRHKKCAESITLRRTALSVVNCRGNDSDDTARCCWSFFSLYFIKACLKMDSTLNRSDNEAARQCQPRRGWKCEQAPRPTVSKITKYLVDVALESRRITNKSWHLRFWKNDKLGKQTVNFLFLCLIPPPATHATVVEQRL